MIHLFWHDNAPNDALRDAAVRWAEHNPSEIVQVWSLDDLPATLRAVALGSLERIDEHDHRRHLGNIARWHLLATYGGVWVDVDTYPLKALPRHYVDRAPPWSAARGTTPTPFVCGGAPHSLWQRALTSALAGSGASPDASGGRMLARIAHPTELRLVPNAYFASHDSAGHQLVAPSEGRVCTHRWATSSTRGPS